MATYVLVPGFWLGGWAWKDVVAPLRAAGHVVYAATLTGLGERVHLGGPQTNLDTHIDDVVNLIMYEELRDVVLVGHSYASLVVAGVADRIPERMSKLVYVDSAPLPDGFPLVAFYSPELLKEYKERVAAQGDGWGLPLPPWEELDQGTELDGLGEAERTHMRSLATAMPFNAALQPLRLANPAREQLPKVAIWCTVSSAQVREMVAAGEPLFQSLTEPHWEFVDLPTGHWPMFSRPGALAEVLMAA